MVLFFYIVDLVVNGLIFLGFAYRYNQTKVRYYLWLALAVLAEAISDVLLAFLTDIGNLNAAVIYVSLILVVLAGLVFVMTVLFLLQDWIVSMRNAPRPAANKLVVAEKVTRILKFAYPALTLGLVIIYVLMIVSLTAAAAIALVVGLAYTACVIVQVAIMIWLWLDVQTASNESQLRKRNQLVRIAALAFFAAWPSLLGGVGVGIGVAVCWWLWYGIALWPNALVGYEQEPEPDTPAGAVYGQQTGYAPAHPAAAYAKQ